MTGENKYARKLLQDRLEIYGQLQAILENVLANKQGSQWGQEQIGAMKDRFSMLKEIDELEEKIRIINSSLMPDRKLMDELRRKMLRVKHLMLMLQIRLEGGKQIISSKLGKVLKGKSIKGYKKSEKVFSESRTCIC